MHETSSQSCSTYEGGSKPVIANKTLSQNCYADEDELSSTEEDKSECTITEQKDAKSEVTYDVPNYFNVFNVFKWGRNLLDRLDVSYERAYRAIPKEKYFTEMLDYQNDYNGCHSEKLQDSVIGLIGEEEEDAQNNVNNVTMMNKLTK